MQAHGGRIDYIHGDDEAVDLAAGDEIAALPSRQLQQVIAVRALRRFELVALKQRLGVELRQKLHKMACKRLGVDDVLFDCARVGQPHADLRVFKLRP